MPYEIVEINPSLISLNTQGMIKFYEGTKLVASVPKTAGIYRVDNFIHVQQSIQDYVVKFKVYALGEIRTPYGATLYTPLANNTLDFKTYAIKLNQAYINLVDVLFQGCCNLDLPSVVFVDETVDLPVTGESNILYVVKTGAGQGIYIWDGAAYVALSGGGSISSLTVSVNQTAHGFAVGDVIRLTSTDNVYAKAQANSLANAAIVGIVTTVTDVDNFIYTAQGTFTSGVPAGTSGTVYYLSSSTAGLLTSTPPTGAGNVILPCVIVLDNATTGIVINTIPKETLFTASRAIVSDSNGLLSASSTTATEIGYVSGVTSAIQTQINGIKWPIAGNINSTTVAASTTTYMIPTITTASTEATRELLVPAGQLQDLGVQTGSTQNAGGSLVFTARKNGASTSAVLTIAAGSAAGIYTIVNQNVSYAAFDRLSVQVQNNYAGGISASTRGLTIIYSHG